jgi:hypothetical protein
LVERVGHRRKRVRHRQLRRGDQPLGLRLKRAPRHPRNQPELEDGFQQLHRRALRKEPLEALDGIDAVQVGLQGLRREVDADLHRIRNQRGQERRRHQRGKHHERTQPYRVGEARDARLLNLLLERRQEPLAAPAHHDGQRQHQRKKNRCAVDLSGAGDLPFLACLLPLTRRRLFRAFLVCHPRRIIGTR